MRVPVRRSSHHRIGSTAAVTTSARLIVTELTDGNRSKHRYRDRPGARPVEPVLVDIVQVWGVWETDRVAGCRNRSCQGQSESAPFFGERYQGGISCGLVRFSFEEGR